MVSSTDVEGAQGASTRGHSGLVCNLIGSFENFCAPVEQEATPEPDPSCSVSQPL